MKPSEILISAAEWLEQSQLTSMGACYALARSSNFLRRKADVAAEAYFWLFRPVEQGLENDEFWWPLRERSERVLALLFAAAMAEAEGN